MNDSGRMIMKLTEMQQKLLSRERILTCLDDLTDEELEFELRKLEAWKNYYEVKQSFIG